ncbi:hypothetical protein ACSVDA_00115 [Cytobacillus sp. Hm23]
MKFQECLLYYDLSFIITHKLKRKTNNLFVLGLSILSVIASAQLLYYDAIIVDELGLGGDEISFYIFLIILIFGFINPIIFLAGDSIKIDN